MPHRLLIVTLFATAAFAFQLPNGPGRLETERLCKQCHELARSISPRQDRAAWNETLTKMTAFGMKASQQDYTLVLDYLAAHYPAEDVPKVNVNKATSIQLESGLSLRRSQAAALIKYRSEHGDFKSIADLKKVPTIDAEKIEAKKDRIAF